MTDANVLKGNTVTFCMCFETLAMNSGRQTEICISLPTEISRPVAETVGTRSDPESARRGTAATAEVRSDRRGLAADGKMTGTEAGAGAGRLGAPTETKDLPDLGTETRGWTDIGAEAERGGGGAEVETGSLNLRIKVRRETVEMKSHEVQAERGKGGSEVETGAQRNQIKVRNLLQKRIHPASKNALKKGRRARRSTRGKARSLIHLESPTGRTSQTERPWILLQHKVLVKTSMKWRKLWRNLFMRRISVYRRTLKVNRLETATLVNDFSFFPPVLTFIMALF